MRDLYKLFDKLVEKRVYFTFQSHTLSQWYNLAVDDIHKKHHYISADNLDEVERQLKVIWGHLLITPLPAGFPQPR